MRFSQDAKDYHYFQNLDLKLRSGKNAVLKEPLTGIGKIVPLYKNPGGNEINPHYCSLAFSNGVEMKTLPVVVCRKCCEEFKKGSRKLSKCF